MNAIEKLWDKLVNAFDGPQSGDKDFNQLPVIAPKQEEPSKLMGKTTPVRRNKKSDKKVKKPKGRKKVLKVG